MSKVTSKLQVTIPKSVADAYGIVAGSEVFFEPAGATIRLRVATAPLNLDLDERLALFDAETERQAQRDSARCAVPPPSDRGWTREELYDRALPR
ncbi:MAG: AbrB/MazE/SpoVT family DNA-binding domain-containing protein [Deltaproteobacteria bacterium]|nr:AbrB/MazE/SpoVT family DNA-binding domain-containing protein [Deltaproteobacteria bacterium]MCB9789242.1 AbrB/MazE/SpoVT family DNA-binding domain-containing protein [Deltaproteobacteria bacterium]